MQRAARMGWTAPSACVVVVALAFGACGRSKSEPGGASGGTAGSDGGAPGGDASGGAGGNPGSEDTCDAGPDEDRDGDGWTRADGDCDDCNPLVNPGAVEVVNASTPLDDDCDGTIDNVAGECDEMLEVADDDPLHAAFAMELCKQSEAPGDWGLVQASWVVPDGGAPPVPQASSFHLGHGILPNFGSEVSVQAGSRLLALSSGTARSTTQLGYQSPLGLSKDYTSAFPDGFPVDVPACPGVLGQQPNDAIGLELTLRVPTNAVGFRYDSKFYTYEWPASVCSPLMDAFLALVSPPSPDAVAGNVAFDSAGNLFSANSTELLTVCSCVGDPPCNVGGLSFACADGPTELTQTGFDEGAATRWLTTRVPVDPGSEITVRFTVFDSGSGVLDSTILLDNFGWIVGDELTAPNTQAKP